MYNNNEGLTPHDALELNEVMNGGMASMKMMQMSMKMAQDPDLKVFMQQNLESRRARIQAMQQFIASVGATSQLQ
jgi:hypothetical protein